MMTHEPNVATSSGGGKGDCPKSERVPFVCTSRSAHSISEIILGTTDDKYPTKLTYISQTAPRREKEVVRDVRRKLELSKNDELLQVALILINHHVKPFSSFDCGKFFQAVAEICENKYDIRLSALSALDAAFDFASKAEIIDAVRRRFDPKWYCWGQGPEHQAQRMEAYYRAKAEVSAYQL